MIESLNTLFDNSVKLFAENKAISITENKSQAKLKRLSLNLTKMHLLNGNQIKDSLLIELDIENDKHRKLSNFFCDNASKVNKRCDFVIFHEKNDYLAVILCDLKSSPRGATDESAKLQFLNSKNFTEYVAGMVNDYECKGIEIRYFYLAFYPSLPVAQPGGLGNGIDKGPTLKSIESDDINLEQVNINSQGEADIQWAKILKMLP